LDVAKDEKNLPKDKKDSGITVNVEDNQKADTLTAKVFVNEKTAPGTHTLELKNDTHVTENSIAKVTFNVAPQGDLAIIKVAPEEIVATGKDQPINIVITGANLRQIVPTFDPNLPLQDKPENSIHESNGETVTIDVIVPAALVPGGKVVMTLKNSNTEKEVKHEIKVVSPPAPTITKFQKDGVDVESGQAGQTIVIIGENLKGASTEVKFGTVTATVSAENIKDSQITVVIPKELTPAAEGIDVTVTTPGGTAKKKFTITAP